MVVHENCVICDGLLSMAGGGTRSQLCSSPNCALKYRNHLKCKLPCCRACGRPMGNYKAAPDFRAVCARSECQTKAASIRSPHASFCRICGIYLSNHSESDTQHVCESPFCKRWDSSDRIEKSQKLRALNFIKRRNDLEELARQRATVLLPELNRGTSRKLIVLPHLEYNLHPSTPERRQRVEAGFLVIAAEAYAFKQEHSTQPETGPDNSGTELSVTDETLEQRFARLNGSACSTCGGRCCQLGGDHAFLKVDKFSEIFRERPDATPEGIVAEYMARVPDESFDYSCVFHGRNGCTLTREQRSITCNNYLCSSLVELRNEVDENNSEFLLAATNLRDEDNPELAIFRMRMVDDHDERVLESAPNLECSDSSEL